MRKYKLDIDGIEKTLGFKPAIFSSKHKVFLDGNQIGEFQSSKEAQAGKEFQINNSNSVNVKYGSRGLSPEITIRHNGTELESSDSHPKTRMKTVFSLIIFLAVLNLGIGFIGATNSVNFVADGGYGVYNLVLGIFYLISIGFILRSSPFLGILLATILYAIDSVAVMAMMMGNPGLGGAIFMRMIFFTILFRGLSSSWPVFKGTFSKA